MDVCNFFAWLVFGLGVLWLAGMFVRYFVNRAKGDY